MERGRYYNSSKLGGIGILTGGNENSSPITLFNKVREAKEMYLFNKKK